ncbi:3,4-dihydroxy-2-butanone-4-phosphate synthase [Pelagibius sp. Alg239-R121]|uniref:3,4-dihydroxy-2-butanone-4-phosphate synthase n=1 Tax=Pelagibius sp. Alg239-R121 TaxID=2993448 RepID=UPI0024A71371|nr:3,4-dihydroxy-2-butanone-4-phosphate synthase [Pelagibius sp. Alg239-R121]
MNTPEQEPWRLTFSEVVSSPEDVIEEARNGRMFILVDDEGRENEGDLVIPAQMATPEAINFMAKYGRGLICLAMTGDRIKELGLPLMAHKNESRHETAFTVSIEAKEGITTGISAPDRAHTVAVAVDPSKGAQDIVTPGHIFPLVAREGGVLVRTGHTEAAVDIARLAGLSPAGVICEIMNDDGTMARRDDLIAFAQKHGLKISTIADLIAYRRHNDHIVERTLVTKFKSGFGGDFNMAIYVNQVSYAEHVALWKGDPASVDEPVLVRMHALNVLDDVLGDDTSGKAGELQRSLEIIGKEGRGVIVLIREPSPKSLSETLRARIGEAPKTTGDLRDYGVGAQILLDLGVRQMILLSNTQRTIVGLEGYGLEVVDQRPID